MKPALLLIDLQHDFLRREELVPSPARIIAQCESLLTACRKLQVPVLHIHTQIRKDGSDRMPHWKREDIWLCVEGTPGVLPPTELQPLKNEDVFIKQFYSGFSDPALHVKLKDLAVDTIMIAGVYLHGCVRSTVLDAYERGFEVWVVDDATGSCEPDHAEITRDYLEKRAARFADTDGILSLLGVDDHSVTGPPVNICPVASIDGKWKSANAHKNHVRHNPSDWREIIATVPLAESEDINEACQRASVAGSTWKNVTIEQRVAVLTAWADVLSTRRQELALLLAREIGKPITDGMAEIDRSISLIQATAEMLNNDEMQLIDKQGPVLVQYCPQGVVGLITPWNNPVAIPVGKIAPALAFGNTAVWKPAVEAPQTAMAVVDTLYQAGATPGILNLVFGEASTTREMIRHPLISAVSFTGSIGAGKSIAAICGRYGKALQAELGGNNAAIVLSDCNIHAQARNMAISAYSFAGQRCTAIQRFIVEKTVLDEFISEFINAVNNLKIGNPSDPSTEIGPLVSESQQHAMCALLENAVNEGAKIYCGGIMHDMPQQGCWFAPAVVANVKQDSLLFREEIFGPIAVIIPADDFDHAIAIANSVKHGLVAALYSNDKSKQQKFADAIECGILNFGNGLINVHPRVPFGGWKASGIGPPEHGIWDRQFYCRVQAIYGFNNKSSKSSD
jgi:acyl-CoA reductase-like NAD-dependent aldehyde dehydrogenase/nicotinamidase-related amidase